MKLNKFFLGLTLSLGLLISNQASSATLPGTEADHFLWMEPIGQQETINSGDTVSINVYLHAEEDDVLHGWSVSMGFDDTAVDGGELTWDSIVFGPSNLVNEPMPYAYEVGNSMKHPGESWINNIARWDVLGLVPPAETLTAGQDFLLFTGNFTFNSGIWDGLEDVWVEDDGPIDGWDFNSGQFHWLEVYTDNTKTTLLGDGGPDYAPVPIPAAVWLLGSGLLGLVGIRRRIAS